MRNMHKVEQGARLAVGLLCGVLGLATGETVLFIPAGIMGVTGALGFCPLYRIFKFDTL